MRVSTRTSRAYRAPALYGEPRFALPPHTPNCVGYGVPGMSCGSAVEPHPQPHAVLRLKMNRNRVALEPQTATAKFSNRARATAKKPNRAHATARIPNRAHATAFLFLRLNRKTATACG